MSGKHPRRKRGNGPAHRSVARRDAPKNVGKSKARRGARYVGRNSRGQAVAPERMVRDDERPAEKVRLTGRMAGEAPNPSRQFGSVAPVERPAVKTPDRSHIRYEMGIPDMAKQLLDQADRIHQPQAGLVAGWASAASAAELCYWRVRQCSPELAGTRDVTALDEMLNEVMRQGMERLT